MTLTTEYVAVVMLANCYITTHIQGQSKVFVEYLETDRSIAQAAAERFAKSKSIPYEESLLQFDRPVLTVLKHGEHWFPAELHAEGVTLLTKHGNQSLGGTQDEASKLAKAIALSHNFDFLFKIGLALTQ